MVLSLIIMLFGHMRARLANHAVAKATGGACGPTFIHLQSARATI